MDKAAVTARVEMIGEKLKENKKKRLSQEAKDFLVLLVCAVQDDAPSSWKTYKGKAFQKSISPEIQDELLDSAFDYLAEIPAGRKDHHDAKVYAAGKRTIKLVPRYSVISIFDVLHSLERGGLKSICPIDKQQGPAGGRS